MPAISLLHGLVENGPSFLRENLITMAVSFLVTILTMSFAKLIRDDSSTEELVKPSQKNDQVKDFDNALGLQCFGGGLLLVISSQ